MIRVLDLTALVNSLRNYQYFSFSTRQTVYSNYPVFKSLLAELSLFQEPVAQREENVQSMRLTNWNLYWS